MAEDLAAEMVEQGLIYSLFAYSAYKLFPNDFSVCLPWVEILGIGIAAGAVYTYFVGRHRHKQPEPKVVVVEKPVPIPIIQKEREVFIHYGRQEYNNGVNFNNLSGRYAGGRGESVNAGHIIDLSALGNRGERNIGRSWSLGSD